MSMSTHVVGYKPADEKWCKMKAIYDACKAADMDPTPAVEKFFEYEAPSDHGVKVPLERLDCVSKLHEDGCNGFVVDLTKLPKDVTVIKFFNSY